MTSTQTIIVTYVGISWRNASVEKSASTAGARLPNVDVNNRLRPETRPRSHMEILYEPDRPVGGPVGSGSVLPLLRRETQYLLNGGTP